MAQLIVRDLEENVKLALRERAKANGHSMEEETRIIIRAAVGTRGNGGKPRNGAHKKGTGFGSRFASHFAELDAPFAVREWNESVKPSRFRR